MTREELSICLRNLRVTDLEQIEVNARTMSLEQCFDLLKIDMGGLDEFDRKQAEVYHKSGVARGIAEATSSLFLQMKAKGGERAAIEYLRNTGVFREEPVATSQPKSGFSFNVNIPTVE